MSSTHRASPMTDVARSNWAWSSMGSRSCAACETRRTSCAANASAPTSAVLAGCGWSRCAPPPTDGAASDTACPFQANERRTAAARTRNDWFSKPCPSACLAEREQVAAWATCIVSGPVVRRGACRRRVAAASCQGAVVRLPSLGSRGALFTGDASHLDVLGVMTRVRAAQGWRGHGWLEVDGPARGNDRRPEGTDQLLTRH